MLWFFSLQKVTWWFKMMTGDKGGSKWRILLLFSFIYWPKWFVFEVVRRERSIISVVCCSIMHGTRTWLERLLTYSGHDNLKGRPTFAVQDCVLLLLYIVICVSPGSYDPICPGLLDCVWQHDHVEYEEEDKLKTGYLCFHW